MIGATPFIKPNLELGNGSLHGVVILFFIKIEFHQFSVRNAAIRIHFYGVSANFASRIV
jgi:hypothetical protein